MACPKCGCKVTYPTDPGWDGEAFPDDMEACAACGHWFDTIDAADEDEDDDFFDETRLSPSAPEERK